MNIKFFFSMVAMLITFIAFIPYIVAILQGKTKPHMFSWVIWGSTTMVVFFAQLQDRGGMGAWPTGLSGTIALFIAFLAMVKKSDIAVTRIDWIFLILGLSSLPLWYLTASPLWTVIILTLIDLTGFGPTFRKAYAFPHDENIGFFMMFVARNTFAILALEHYSATTLLFPITIMGACCSLAIMVIYRRRVLKQ